MTKFQEEMAVLAEAAEALKEADRLRRAVRANEERLRRLCRAYDEVSGSWGIQPHHLRQTCEARGLLDIKPYIAA